MISLYYYHELIGNIEEHEGKNLKVDDYVLNKVLHKIKRLIGIGHFHNTMILIDTDDK